MSAKHTTIGALRALLDELHKHGEWDDGCFYYGGKAAPELQGPITNALNAIQQNHGIDEKAIVLLGEIVDYQDECFGALPGSMLERARALSKSEAHP